MRILIINNVFGPGYVGGYELGALEVARGLKAHGDEILVLTSNYFQDDAGEMTDIAVERNLDCIFVSHHVNEQNAVEQRGFHIDYGNIRKVASAVRRFRPDVAMLFNTMGLGPLGLQQFFQAAGIPVILYFMDNVYSLVQRHSGMYHNFCKVLGEPKFNGSTRIIAMSYNVTHEIEDCLGVQLRDVTYIPGWIHVDPKTPEPECTDHGPTTSFVVCSRIAAHKGIQLVIDSAAALVKQGLTNFTVDMYGAGEVSLFLQNIQANGVSDYVRYMGNVPKDEMLARFADYDALLFPTWVREPFGFTVSEAAAAGCIPVMTGGIGASEWFIDGIDCFKIGRDNNFLTAVMKHLMAMPAEQKINMRKQSMRSARRYLNFDRWIALISKMCHEIKPPEPVIDRTHGVQAALLFLNQLWRESL